MELEQEDIRMDNPMLLYRQIKSGLAEGLDVVTDSTLIYDKEYRLRLSEINKYLLDNVYVKQDKTIQVTLYKLSDGPIVLTEELRNNTLGLMMLDNWLYSSLFDQEGMIYAIHGLRKTDNTLETLDDGYKWTQAEFFSRSYDSIPDMTRSVYKTIYVTNCTEQPLTPVGGSYNWDNKLLTGVVWKSASGLNLTWYESVRANDTNVWMSYATVYSDSGTITWSTPTLIVMNAGELLRNMKGTCSVAVTLFSSLDNPSTLSITNVFCHPKLLKQGAGNPWVVVNGDNLTPWNQSSSVWRENMEPDGVLWKTTRVCTYDEDNDTLTGTPWTEPVKYIDIDGILEAAENSATTAALTAIETATQAIEQARLDAVDITTAMTSALETFTALKDEYELNVSDSLLLYSNLTDKYTEYFGTGGKVDTALADLNKQAGNTDLIIADLLNLGGYLNPYTPTLLNARTTNGERIFVIGDIVRVPSSVINSGRLTYKISDDSKWILVVNGKYLKNENFTLEDITGENSFYNKKLVIICGDYTANEKSLSNSYVVDPENVKVALNEFKNETNGVLSAWGLKGQGVQVGVDGNGDAVVATNMQAIFDAAKGEISTQIASATESFEGTYVSLSLFLLTAEQISLAALNASYLKLGNIDNLASGLSGTIALSSRYDMYGTISLVTPNENPTYNVSYGISAYRLDGESLLYTVGNYGTVSTKDFVIYMNGPSGVIKTFEPHLDGYEGDVIYKAVFTNNSSDTVNIILRYSIEAALATLGVNASGITAEVVNSIKNDNETLNSIGSSILTSEVFSSSVSSVLEDMSGLTKTQLAEVFGDLGSVTTTVAEWTESGIDLSVMQSDLLVAKDKIEGTIIEALLVETGNLTLEPTSGGYQGNITLPVEEVLYSKGGSNPESSGTYNSPYYVLYDGGTLEYRFNNNGEWLLLNAGLHFELGNKTKTLNIRIKKNSSNEFMMAKNSDRVYVRYGYNTIQAMSKSVQTARKFSNELYGTNGISGIYLDVNNIKAQVYDSDGQTSRIASLILTANEIKTAVGLNENGANQTGTILNRIGLLELNLGNINYSILKKVTISKNGVSEAITLPYDECSYQLQFTDLEGATVSYALTANSSTTPSSYTNIIANGVIDIAKNATDKTLWIKYTLTGEGSVLDSLNVNVGVQTAVMVGKVSVTPQSITASVSLELSNSNLSEEARSLKTALLNITSDNISSILALEGPNGELIRTAIIQSINDGASSTLISADVITLDGNTIARAINAKSLNIDNLTYINSGNSAANKSVVLNINKNDVVGVGKDTEDIYYYGDIDNIRGAKNIKITPLKLYYDVKGLEGEFINGNTNAIDFRVHRQSDDADLGGGACGDTINIGNNDSIYITVQGDYDIIIASEINETKEAGEEDINADDVIPTGVSYNISYELTAKDSISGVEYDGSSNVYPLMAIGCGTTGLSVFNSNGSGYFAGGLISWDKYRLDENGLVVIENGKKKTGGSSLVLDIQGIINAKAGTIAGWTLAAKGTAPSTHTHIFTRSLKSGNKYNYLDLSPDYGIRCYSSESLKGLDDGPFNYWLDVDGSAKFARGKASFNSDGTFKLGNENEYIEFDSNSMLKFQGKGFSSLVGELLFGTDEGYIDGNGLHVSAQGSLPNIFKDSKFNDLDSNWGAWSYINYPRTQNSNPEVPSGNECKVGFNSPLNGELPIIKLNVLLVKGEYYTLSFYAKISENAGLDACVGVRFKNGNYIDDNVYIYDNNSTIVKSTKLTTDSEDTTYKLCKPSTDISYSRHNITFKVDDSYDGSDIEIALFASGIGVGKNAWISSPKLEHSKSPTAWVNGDTVYKSYIEQLGNSIKLLVLRNTGVEVTDTATYLTNQTCGFALNNSLELFSRVFDTALDKYNGAVNRGYLANGNIKWYTKKISNTDIGFVEMKNVVADLLVVECNGTADGLDAINEIDEDKMYFVNWDTAKTLSNGSTINGSSTELRDSDPVILFKRYKGTYDDEEVFDFFVLNPLLLSNGETKTYPALLCLDDTLYKTPNRIILEGVINRFNRHGRIDKIITTKNGESKLEFRLKYNNEDVQELYSYNTYYGLANFPINMGNLYAGYIMTTGTPSPEVSSALYNPIIEITKFTLSYIEETETYSDIAYSTIYLVPIFNKEDNYTLSRDTGNGYYICNGIAAISKSFTSNIDAQCPVTEGEGNSAHSFIWSLNTSGSLITIDNSDTMGRAFAKYDMACIFLVKSNFGLNNIDSAFADSVYRGTLNGNDTGGLANSSLKFEGKYRYDPNMNGLVSSSTGYRIGYESVKDSLINYWNGSGINILKQS